MFTLKLKEAKAWPLSGGGSRRKVWLAAVGSRSDRLIATVRVFLALSSCYVAWLDAAHPQGRTDITYALVGFYLIHALISAAVVWNAKVAPANGALLRHVIDVSWIVAILFLTDGPTSPYFMFLPFALLSSTLDWHWRGAVVTGSICFVAVGILIATDTDRVIDIDAESTTDVTSMVFMVASSILLVWVGMAQENVKSELLRIVEKSPPLPSGPEWPYRAALDYAAHVFEAPVVLLLWTEADEPWTYVAEWREGVASMATVGPSVYAPWVAETVTNANLLVPDKDESSTILDVSDGRFVEVTGSLVHPALIRDYGVGAFVSPSFQSDDFQARLFVLDPPGLSAQQMAIAEVVADRLRTLFEQSLLLRRLGDEAAIEERLRIARDLHDGVLQALTGTALQLESLRTVAAADKQTFEARLSDIVAMIGAEQADLRAFIDQLNASDASVDTLGAAKPRLDQQLQSLGFLLQKRWSIEFAIASEPVDLELPRRAVAEITRMVSEATANAVRHAGATDIRATVGVEGGRVRLTVSDNGAGLGFEGRKTHAELAAARIGPRSLRERTEELGGELSVIRDNRTTVIDVIFPLTD